jgi:hypothetical protein
MHRVNKAEADVSIHPDNDEMMSLGAVLEFFGLLADMNG